MEGRKCGEIGAGMTTIHVLWTASGVCASRQENPSNSVWLVTPEPKTKPEGYTSSGVGSLCSKSKQMITR